MKLVALLGLGLLGLTLTGAGGPNVEALSIDSIGLPRKASIADPPVLRVNGHYPTPLWQFARWEMQVKGSTIELTPYGLNRQKPDQMVAQVLIPFQLPKVLAGVRPGKYTVVVKGRNKTCRAPLELTDATIERGFPYLDEITLPKAVQAGKAATMTVKGNLPDMAWQGCPPGVKFADGIVWVYPWGERKRKVFAAEALKPTEWQVTLPTLPAGDYLVVVEGRFQTERRPLTVSPAPKEPSGQPA